jgi:hypothetical protein
MTDQVLGFRRFGRKSPDSGETLLDFAFFGFPAEVQR